MSEVQIRRLTAQDAQALLELRTRNRDFLRPFEPVPAWDHFTLAFQQQTIEKAELNWTAGTGYGFGIFLGPKNRLIGRVNLSNVVRGAFESCTLGYFIDKQEGGRGYMTLAVHLAVKFAFEEASLHRVQAAVMPRNQGSRRVLEKVGFVHEGFAPYYLNINGVWEDHDIFGLTREVWH